MTNTETAFGHCLDSPWPQLTKAWQRRDSRPLRALMERIVGPDAVSVWRALSHAIYENRPEFVIQAIRDLSPSVPPISDSEADWSVLASGAVTAIESRITELPEELQEAAIAHLGVFLYFEELCFWEHSDEYPRILGVIGVHQSLVARWHAGHPEGTARPFLDIALATARLGQTLEPQFGTESAMGCSCPVHFESQAALAGDAIRLVRSDLQRIAQLIPCCDRHATGTSGTLLTSEEGLTSVVDPFIGHGALGSDSERGLLALLLQDCAHTLGYLDLLRDHVAPSVRRFDDNLTERTDDDDVVVLLNDAIAASDAYEASAIGRSGVFSSETRSHRASLTTMRDRLQGSEPSLRVDQGEISLLYPFGLPTSSGGDTLVAHLVRSDRHKPAVINEQETSSLRLAGAIATVEDTPRSDIWTRSQRDEFLDDGVRLGFRDEELVLETTAGLRYYGLDVEVRLNGLGNHFVRLTVSTNTELSCRDSNGVWQQRDVNRTRPWTPHDLDQWTRRIGYDVGEERLWFQPRRLSTDESEPTARSERQFERLVDVAVAIIDDLIAITQRLHTGEPGTLDLNEQQVQRDTASHAGGELRNVSYSPEELEIEREQITQAASVHAQVLATVTSLTRLHPRRHPEPVIDPVEIIGLFGSSTLLNGERRYPTSLDEWVRSRPPVLVNLLGSDGIDGELVVRNQNLTLAFATSTPHWQLISLREIVEFAASLAGAYTTWIRWLTRTIRRSATLIDHAVEGNGLEDLLQESIDLVERQSRVRALLDHVRSSELMRNRRNRHLLDELIANGGVDQLEADLSNALAAVNSQQEWAAAQVERLVERRDRAQAEERRIERELESRRNQTREERRRRSGFIVEAALALLAVLGLTEFVSWLNQGGQTNEDLVFFIEFAVIVTLVIVLGIYLWRVHSSTRDKDDPPG